MLKATKKYTIAYTYKGIGIYTLKVADPTKDSLGYVVDSEYVEGEFSTIGEAIEAIDTNEKQIGKKPKIINHGTNVCHECQCDLLRRYSYCPDCGTKIDWGDEE